MGDILDIIKSRRTIKFFTPKFVSWEKISNVLEAGRHAPSCGNIQNWKFIVSLDAGKKQALAKAAHEQYEIASAAALITICGEAEKAKRYYGLRGERLFTIQNCAAAAQNMLLEAHSLGLGGRWIGAFDEEEVRSLLGLPDDVRPQIILAIGHPKEIPEKPPKYPLEPIAYFEGWRGRIRDAAKYMNDYATILARKAHKVADAAKKATGFVVDKTKNVVGKKEDKN